MPARSKIDLLPDAIRQELSRLLISGAFSDYEGITAWLNDQIRDLGLEISIVSRSAVHRFGQGLERAQKALKNSTEMAIALTDYAGDDAGKTNDAVMRLYVDKLFHVLLDMEDLDPEDVDFAKLGRVISQVTRASVNQKKWMSEMREKTKQAADDVVKVVKKGGLSEETAETIRKKILGIV
jgi:predicted nucleotidyltransferase